MLDLAKSKYNPIMERKMESHMTTIVSAGILSVALWLPANAGEKITGRNSDYQLLSEFTATIPDKPGHILRQRTTTFKVTSSSARLGDFWVTQAAQEEVIGRDITSKGYVTGHFANGDVAYLSFEGTAKFTPKEPGAFETVAQGKFEWTGGTGKHDVKGPGTYTCNFTQSGGGCDWQGEAEFSGM
jgi:hypothetical protein